MSPNCTAPESRIQPNADIAGYGVSSDFSLTHLLVHESSADRVTQVMIAFIMSALVTIAAVIYAYISDSMHRGYLTDIDALFIEDLQYLSRKFLESSPCLFFGLCWISILSVFPRRKTDVVHRKLEREQREAAITRFILALSDQQLVVGLAILIAAIANQSTLSLLEFQVAFGLAWFSATTHLATLVGLKDYLRSHRQIRNWRVVSILVFIVLFLYSFIVLLLADGSPGEIPVACFLRLGFAFAPLNLIVNLFSGIITLIVLVNGYKDWILQSYGFNTSGFGPGILAAKLQIIVWKLCRPDHHGLETASLDEWKHILDEAILERWSEVPTRMLYKMYKTTPQWSSEGRLKRISAMINLSSHMYSRSLLQTYPLFSFMVTYGFVQIVMFRWVLPNFEESTKMGFGQITSLFLLVLPVFAAAELYYGRL
jgi:hypothetical protein